MPDWTDGYVADIAYTGGFYFEQTPAHLDVACLTQGIEPAVGPGEPFTYCELGCGLGDTAMIIAAAERRAQVWGIDFNPAHIARARSVASRTGLDNVTFLERSFEELARAESSDVPDFDYITLHGVWSWISPASQAHLVTFLRRHLKPGGVVYISYNAMPGWANVIGLQRLLLDTSPRTGLGSERRVRDALGLARRIADAGDSWVDENALKRLEKVVESGQLSYASHEYLNEHWRPVFFAEVAAAMAQAKLSFICAADLIHNFAHLSMTPEQCALIANLPVEQRQSVQDFYIKRTFRKDIFMRGSRSIAPLTYAARIGAQRLVLTVPKAQAKLKIEIPLGEATLNGAFYEPALATLGTQVTTIQELLAQAAPGTAPASEEVLGLLVGGNQVKAVAGTPDAETIARVRRFNRARLSIAAEDSQHSALIAAAGLGSAIGVGLLEMLVYDVIAGGEEAGIELGIDAIRAGVFALLTARRMNLKADIPDVAEGLAAEIRIIVDELVPIWRRIGAL